MPAVYERAYGGPATPTNPIGTGDDPNSPLPNIVDADNPFRPAAFGPIASSWPLRRRKLGALERRALELPIMVLPSDFDGSYFQSAPPDQQVSGLGPTASFVLEGFHAERPRVEIGLPQALPAGAVYGLSSGSLDSGSLDAPSRLDFRVDTVHIDTQAWVLTLTYRACVELPREATLDRLTVAAGLGMNGRVPVLPEARPSVKEAQLPPRQVQPVRRSPLMDTVNLAALPAGRVKTLPFGKSQPTFAAPATAAPPPAAARPPESEKAPPARTWAAAVTPPPEREKAPPARTWAADPGSAVTPPPAREKAPRPTTAKQPPRVNVMNKLYGARNG